MNMDSDINSKWQKFLKAKYLIKISFKFSTGALAAFNKYIYIYLYLR